MDQMDEGERNAAYSQLASYDNTKDIEKYFYRRSLLQTHNIIITEDHRQPRIIFLLISKIPWEI